MTNKLKNRMNELLDERESYDNVLLDFIDDDDTSAEVRARAVKKFKDWRVYCNNADRLNYTDIYEAGEAKGVVKGVIMGSLAPIIGYLVGKAVTLLHKD